MGYIFYTHPPPPCLLLQSTQYSEQFSFKLWCHSCHKLGSFFAIKVYTLKQVLSDRKKFEWDTWKRITMWDSPLPLFSVPLTTHFAPGSDLVSHSRNSTTSSPVAPVGKKGQCAEIPFLRSDGQIFKSTSYDDDSSHAGHGGDSTSMLHLQCWRHNLRGQKQVYKT